MYKRREAQKLMDEYISVYGKRIFGLCMALCASRYDADDLYQETWLRALKKINSYDKSKPFEPWVSRICVNAYRDFLRRKKISPVADPFGDTNEKDEMFLHIAEKEPEDRSDVREAVERLPEKLKITVILFYFSDLGEKRTAEILKVPEGTVKSRLNKAKKLLKEELKGEYGL